MKKLLLLFVAILMASTGLWAETVKYIDANGQEKSVEATVVENASELVTWGTADETTWYVVTGDVTLSKGAICAGNVNLILADGAKLTATGSSLEIQDFPGDLYYMSAIIVSNSLTIYGQVAQSGQLEANGLGHAAGISGSGLIINGGVVTANGGESGVGINGSGLIINGGVVTANGGERAAGIGVNDNSDGSGLIINGGTVTAIGGGSAAGIGGRGEYGPGSGITINGGTVTAIGGDCAAGIGGGRYGSGSNITINGGIVTATGGLYAAGIGGGQQGSGSNITINSGTVTANGGNGADGIGNGKDATTSSSNIFVATWCIVKAGSSSDPTTEIATERTSTTDISTYLADKQYVTVETHKFVVTYGDNITVSPAFTSGAEIEAGTQITFTAADRSAAGSHFLAFYEEGAFDTPITTGVNGQIYTVKVTDAAISVYAKYNHLGSYVYPVYNFPPDATRGVKDWETETVNAIEVTSSDTPVTWGEADKETWYVVTGEDVQLSQGAICKGNVNLILADGAKLTATGINDDTNKIYTPGIRVSNDGSLLTIYGQTAQSGQLEANGGTSGAGIGGGLRGDGSFITINGGTVTANGGETGAGIGGGENGNGSYITINGGTVTANGGVYAGAGIGGGNACNGSNITINGGTVTANGGMSAAGIGGGSNGYGNIITINGGAVTANGGVYAGNGIGDGENGARTFGIFVTTNLIVKADGNNPPTTVIENDHFDLTKSLEGKRYVTITEVFNITANQDPNNKANYYSTFYSSKKAYSVPEGVTAYTGVVDGDVLKLTAIEGGVIPAGEAVILRLTTEDNTATKKQFDLTATTTTATKSTDNKLSGTDVAKTLGANDYALSLGQYGVGFYLWNGKSIDAHKAYLTLPASSASSAKAFTFQFEDETDAIHSINVNDSSTGSETGDNMYNLNGVRVNDNYKGIVIRNGKKIYQK